MIRDYEESFFLSSGFLSTLKCTGNVSFFHNLEQKKKFGEHQAKKKSLLALYEIKASVIMYKADKVLFTLNIIH